MLAALSAEQWAFIVLGTAAGGLVRGFTGFGFAMIFMPIVASVLTPKMALAVIWVIDAPFAMLIGAQAIRKADLRGVSILLAAATLFFPLGLYVITHVEPVPVRWMISVLVVGAVAMLASGWRYQGRPSLALTIGVGATSGLLNGLASLSGLPLALFWLASQTRRPHEIRSDLQVYIMLSTLISGSILLFSTVLNLEATKIALTMMPVYGLMIYAGSRGFAIASEATFRRIAYLVILAAAILSIPLLDKVLR